MYNVFWFHWSSPSQTLYKTQVRELKEEKEDLDKKSKEYYRELSEIKDERYLIVISIFFMVHGSLIYVFTYYDVR